MLVRIVPALIAVAALALCAACGGDDVSLPEPSITVTDTTISLDNFPAAIDIAAQLDAEPVIATLIWRALPVGEPHQVAAQVDPDDPASITARIWTIRATDEYLWLPPGTDIEWSWRIAAPDGGVTQTEPQVWRFDDPLRDWRTQQADGIEIAFYSDAYPRDYHVEFLIQSAAQAREEALTLLDSHADAPLRIIVWESRADALAAYPWGDDWFAVHGAVDGPLSVGAGLVHLIGTAQPLSNHLAAAVARSVGASALGAGWNRLPLWFPDGFGLAVRIDGSNSILGNSLIPRLSDYAQFRLSEMSTPTANRYGYQPWYDQGAAMMRWLLEREGVDPFARFASALADGASLQDAVRDIYGMSPDQFDAAFFEETADDPLPSR